jgi:hypothetical protein
MSNSLHRLGRWALMLSLGAAATISQAQTQVSIGISVPGISIGINTPQYPQFVRVPSHPVYYAPQQGANLFFYDGLYWVYQRDDWYFSSWFNGPWYAVGPQRVPASLLRIPVRYYRDPPGYFHRWRADSPPHWGEHWGDDWQQQRRGWDHWDRSAVPAPAPLPNYQRQYSGDRYPKVKQQQELHGRNYGYQPLDAGVREQVRERAQQHGIEDRTQGRPEAQDVLRPAGPERDGAQSQGQGTGNGNGKAKGQDKDRKDSDSPGQQHKK